MCFLVPTSVEERWQNLPWPFLALRRGMSRLWIWTGPIGIKRLRLTVLCILLAFTVTTKSKSASPLLYEIIYVKQEGNKMKWNVRHKIWKTFTDHYQTKKKKKRNILINITLTTNAAVDSIHCQIFDTETVFTVCLLIYLSNFPCISDLDTINFLLLRSPRKDLTF